MDRISHSERQGADIFTSDMVHIDEESKIVNIFENATVFLTGGTGFLGKIFLEKILRVCPKVKMVYLLLRPKKGKDIETRFEEIFDGPNMVPLKLSNSRYLEKVSIIHGDCALPDLGLSNEDKSKIIEEVNLVIHCAATVRFDEKLKKAAHVNVRGVRDLLVLAKKMKKLRGFLHVSTAFSYCPSLTIDEVFYKPGLDADDLLRLVEMLDEEKLDKITPTLIGDWPNTYVFTKCIAEDLVKKELDHLPLAIIRPSIVIASLNEPVSGWIDNYYGPTGLMIAVGLGLLRSVPIKENDIAEIVPADFVVNAALAILWDCVRKNSSKNNVANFKSSLTEASASTVEPIYHVVSQPNSPITWGEFLSKAKTRKYDAATEMLLWYPFAHFRPNRIHHLIACFFLHTVPAYLIDFLCYCTGRPQRLVKGYEKIHRGLDVLSYFIHRQWQFKNKNTQELWSRMDREDKRLFHFNMENFDWDVYFGYYLKGARVYLLKDPLETLPKGIKKYKTLERAHYTLMVLLLLLFCFFVKCMLSLIF